MKIFERVATGRRAAATFVAFLVLSIVWFQWGPAAALTATGVPLLDTQTGYTPEQAYAQLESYGELGRSRYALFLVGDFIWILFFGVTVALVLLVAVDRVARGGTHWGWIVLVPAGVVAFDWLENASLLAVTVRHPERLDRLTAAAPVFTAAKMILMNVTLFLFVAAVLGIAVSYALRLRQGARVTTE